MTHEVNNTVPKVDPFGTSNFEFKKFKKKKNYSPWGVMDARSRYSRTSESKKQIKVRITFEKEKISFGCIQESN